MDSFGWEWQEHMLTGIETRREPSSGGKKGRDIIQLIRPSLCHRITSKRPTMCRPGSAFGFTFPLHILTSHIKFPSDLVLFHFISCLFASCLLCWKSLDSLTYAVNTYSSCKTWIKMNTRPHYNVNSDRAQLLISHPWLYIQWLSSVWHLAGT